MALAEILSNGWIIILLGAGFLMLEVFSPGFFLAVPGTVLIIIGILILLGFDIFESSAGIIVGVVIAFIASGLTIWIYSRLTPDEEKPRATSMDSVIGKSGLVLKAVNPDTISGKVELDGQEWSARSTGAHIPENSRIVVVSSQGVHVVVQEV
ncbi:MAG: NfeD family protein [Methanospirillaceae archaeon]|nr:NfeD family protein [Methanospirillaceae archaeon]